MTRMNGIMGVVVSSIAVLVVVLVGWFFFVSPQRSKADRTRRAGRRGRRRSSRAIRRCSRPRSVRTRWLRDVRPSARCPTARGLGDPAPADRVRDGVAD